MKSLKSQFLFDLGEICDAEHRIARALPRMIKSDTSDELKAAILSHSRETEGHVKKVEQLFECFGHYSPGDDLADPCGNTLASDEALISALKMVEQGEMPRNGCQRDWEIASYGCLQEWAKLLGSSEGADLLEQILEDDEIARQCGPDHARCIDKKAM